MLASQRYSRHIVRFSLVLRGTTFATEVYVRNVLRMGNIGVSCTIAERIMQKVLSMHYAVMSYVNLDGFGPL
jgi:hypothetical protein